MQEFPWKTIIEFIKFIEFANEKLSRNSSKLLTANCIVTIKKEYKEK
jgi:hypothetical protein